MRKVLGIALLSLPVGLALLLWLGLLQNEPAVSARVAAEAIDLDRLQTMLRQQVHLRESGFADIALNEGDVNQLVNHLLRQQRWPAEARVTLAEGGVVAIGAIDTGLPRRWLNVRMRLEEKSNELHARAMMIGRFPVPAMLLPPMERMLIAQLRRHEAWPAIEQALAAIEGLDISPDRLLANVRLATPIQSETAARQGELLFGPAVQRSLPRYVAALKARVGSSNSAVLPDLLPPLFALARQQEDGGADAVVENRALLLALTLHSVPPQLLRTLGPPQASAAPDIRPLRLTLHNRRDLAQHFLISALLASYGDEALATRAGLHKELRDRTTASGFDATDLLADYAGIAFGSLAASEASRLQEWMQVPRAAGDFMPPVTALSPAAVTALSTAAATGELAELEQAAEQHMLPLLASTQLYRELP